MEPGTSHLHLAIELGSNPIRGSLKDGALQDRRFTGWIELAEAIERVRRGESRPQAKPPKA